MKNFFKVIFIYVFFNIFFMLDCYADLTESQADEIAAFAENLVLKSNNEHRDSSGLPLIAYSQEHRNDGMKGNLSYFNKDDKNINTIASYKWAFDCASFASYIYYNALDIYTFIDSNKYRPYTVGYFVSNANNEVDFKNVMRGVKVSNIDFNLLKKGDLIIFVGEHIMVYIGDGKIAHVSTSAIVKGGSLGAEVVSLKDKYGYKTATVIRIADGRISSQITPNVNVTWPDTKVKEYLGRKDDKPIIEIPSVNNVTKEYSFPITFSDDKGLIAYSIGTNPDPDNWQNLNKQLTYSTTYKITENGTYYIFVKDSKNQLTVKTLDVDFIDNDVPVIKNISCKYNNDNTFNITVTADDKSNVKYSLDNINYGDDNSFNNLMPNSYVIYVKDEVGNLSYKLINLSDDVLNMSNYTIDNKYAKEIELYITFNAKVSVESYNVVDNLNEPTEWITIDKHYVKYKITENGTYYLWTKNKDGISIYNEIVINRIDKKPPTILKMTTTNIDSKMNLLVEAVDNECGIEGYSLDNKKYQESPTFYNLKSGVYTVFVKDKCGNINSKRYNVLSNSDNNSNILTILIIFLCILVAVIVCVIIKKRKKY